MNRAFFTIIASRLATTYEPGDEALMYISVTASLIVPNVLIDVANVMHAL